MRRSVSEKMEIIRIVEGSELSVRRTLEELGVVRSTFYEWYRRYLEEGFEGLKPRSAWILMEAANEYMDKTTNVHQQWQTDFTYFKIIGWGRYYLSTVLDNYSRYINTWDLCSNMESDDAKRSINAAIQKIGVNRDEMPRLLTDNGSSYISNEFNNYLTEINMGHVRGAPYHPQTQGKIERYHRTMKNVIKLENYFFPDELREKLAEFGDYYNNRRYHESLGNVTPANVYFDRAKKIKMQRQETKTLKERRKKNQKIPS